METVSVSKGVFAFKNGFQKRERKKSENYSKNGLFDNELWYQAYKESWSTIENQLEKLNTEMFSSVLKNLVDYIKCAYTNEVSEIPTAALLTGINMPDHEVQFSALSKELKVQVTSHVAILHAHDCTNLKSLVENIINQLINSEIDESSDDDDNEKDHRKSGKKLVKKTQCSFAVLESWYESFKYSENKKQVIALIFPDFESFNCKVLQDFIQIASSYINSLPFVLTFGVATSLTALNKSLPYHVSSRVNIQVFNSQSSTNYLNNVLENVILSENCPFHLGGNLFALFMDIFLFYDFSVTGFIQNFKYAMLEHFSRGNQSALCANAKTMKKHLRNMSANDLDAVRRSCLSFRSHVERQEPATQVRLLEDDEYFKEDLQDALIELTNYINKLHVFLKCLQILVEDLPKAPLGKQIRELYILTTTSNDEISTLNEFKEAFLLLEFSSKEQLVMKINKIIRIFKDSESVLPLYSNISQELFQLTEKLQFVTRENVILEENQEEQETLINMNVDRKQLKDQLLKASRKSTVKTMNEYEKCRMEILEFLKKMFVENLKQPKSFVYHELFFFNDLSIQNNIIGSHRAAIHTALNDPQSYLNCVCCKLSNEASILDTMPDICVAYKLHLEYGKNINVYDWFQAYLSILDPIAIDEDQEQETRDVDPKLQARFTQSVAELEYLGFIKNSKRKTDHVTRLTWGG